MKLFLKLNLIKLKILKDRPGIGIYPTQRMRIYFKVKVEKGEKIIQNLLYSKENLNSMLEVQNQKSIISNQITDAKFKELRY